MALLRTRVQSITGAAEGDAGDANFPWGSGVFRIRLSKDSRKRNKGCCTFVALSAEREAGAEVEVVECVERIPASELSTAGAYGR